MSLGAKKRDELVDAAHREFMRGAGTVRSGISAVVDLLLAREEARVAPLLAALKKYDFGAGTWAYDALAADAAAQADAPEPTLAELAERLVSDTTMRGQGDRFCGVRVEHFDALKAALAREKRGAS